jgi:hypothetical protein
VEQIVESVSEFLRAASVYVPSATNVTEKNYRINRKVSKESSLHIDGERDALG